MRNILFRYFINALGINNKVVAENYVIYFLLYRKLSLVGKHPWTPTNNMKLKIFSQNKIISVSYYCKLKLSRLTPDAKMTYNNFCDSALKRMRKYIFGV